MNAATLLLGERSRFGGQRLGDAVGTALARADCSQHTGRQLARAFDVLPRGWPVAAVTRQRDVGDARNAVWLRADPAYIRPDLSGARLMAYGEALNLGAADVEALLPGLKPLFGDFGFLLDAPLPSRWYLQLPPGAQVPKFASPDEVLGAELFEQMPGSDPEGQSPNALADSRRWRALLNESQVLLHNHPHNADRVAAGLAPVNSLWFWGAGTMPDHVRSVYTGLLSDDEALAAFALMAGIDVQPLSKAWRHAAGNVLLDLRHERDLARLQADWLGPMLADLRARRLDQVTVDFADGTRYALAAGQRWRFWRRPLRSLLA
ncbi:MAG TPA: phosphoglycerate mutase [Lysobacter sp.]|nr:phosphoglycerate mutase [Lysobacter sp.]